MKAMFDGMNVIDCDPDDPTRTIAEFWAEDFYYRVWFHAEGVDSTCHPTGPIGYADHHTYYAQKDGRNSVISNSQQYMRHYCQ